MLAQTFQTDQEVLMVTKTHSCKISTSSLLTMAKRTIQTMEAIQMLWLGPALKQCTIISNNCLQDRAVSTSTQLMGKLT